MATAFADLAMNLPAGELDQVMLDATRACEDAADRRLAPFTIVETKRLDGGDMDDFGSAAVPLPMNAQMGLDYSNALQVGQMVRHCWVDQYPPRYQELWTGAVSQVNVFWPYQSTPYALSGQSVLYEPDTGHIRFLIGSFVPFGSSGQIFYSGGYTTVPASLRRACLSMAASIIIKELDPSVGGAHDPDLLRDEAIEFLIGFTRD